LTIVIIPLPLSHLRVPGLIRIAPDVAFREMVRTKAN